jgi:hypothetical protein
VALCANKSDRQLTRLCSTDSARLPSDFFEIEKELFGALQKRATCSGQFHAPTVPFQQRHPD